MAGIYLHIPFCRQACHYCDFHFSTNTEIRGELVRAMGREIMLQRGYLNGEPVKTIYFGGGTPSILPPDEIGYLLKTIDDTLGIPEGVEITLEANPDDLSLTRLKQLRSLGINRLSIGIQSFDDAILTYLNRSHSAKTAVQCIADARAAAFENISIDLIYAIPGLSPDAWTRNLECALQIAPDHISAYSLTIEEKTAFGNQFTKGTLIPVDEPTAANQMEILMSVLTSNGYRQYEISNFALPGYQSIHNSNYWKGERYLGIGPSAHSYNAVSRQHNVSNNHLYVRSLLEDKIPAVEESLTRNDQINEYILTTLRTDDGCDLQVLKNSYRYDLIEVHGGYLHELERRNLILIDHQSLKLTDAGRFLADKISSDLFFVE